MESLLESPAATAAPSRSEPIVVATDGLPQSRGALAVARSLATRLQAKLHVVAVNPLLNIVSADAQSFVDPNLVASMRADLTQRVRAQCQHGVERPDDYEILNGEPACVIRDVSSGRHARLIVLGLGRHELVDRLFGDETALKVVRSSHVPVLAVPEAGCAVPRHAVVGIDFSEGSLVAARAALELLVDGGALELVHVVPRERLLFDGWVSQEEYVHFVRHSLTRFRARLIAPEDVNVADIILTGDPAKELLGYAQRVAADLVATGSHGHGFVSRLIVGSVTTKLLRTATCCVLVTPADSLHLDRHRVDTNATLNLDRSRWIEVLDDFTRRNAGRRTRLEVDDPELGAQPQEEDYPLLGITFDPVDGRVEIMLGELGAGEPHLSRSVAEVKTLDVMTDRDDRDLALRLCHGSGQTILSLLR